MHAHLNFAIGFGFFPAIVTLLLARHTTGRARGQNLTNEQIKLRMIERTMLIAGATLLFFILFV
jgi:hypothetical protein